MTPVHGLKPDIEGRGRHARSTVGVARALVTPALALAATIRRRGGLLTGGRRGRGAMSRSSNGRACDRAGGERRVGSALRHVVEPFLLHTEIGHGMAKDDVVSDRLDVDWLMSGWRNHDDLT